MPISTIKWITLGVILLLTFSLSGCTSRPEFSPPIRWGDGDSAFSTGEVKPLDPRLTAPEDPTIELWQNGKGFVKNMPRGQQIDDDDLVRKCVHLSHGVYTGEINWQSTSRWTFEIEFPGSRYTITDNLARFNDEDWSAVRIIACDFKYTWWQLGIECGDYDTGSRFREIEPCRAPDT